MSLALDSASPVTEIRPPATGIPFLPNSTIFDSPAEGGDVNECSTSSTSSTSSIGKNSDLSGGGVSSEENYDDENEVESSYKRALDSMDSLEEALPMRTGISKFYNGKSKSFTSLAEASSSSSSIIDIAKPENAYSRKRRNLLAFSHIIDKNRSFPRGISKRPISTSKSTLALAVAMSSSESISSSTSEDSSNSKSPPHLPPLHPRSRASQYNLASYGLVDSSSPWRSYSVADLQHCVSTNSGKIHH